MAPPPPPSGGKRQQLDELRKIHDIIRGQRMGFPRFREIREGQGKTYVCRGLTSEFVIAHGTERPTLGEPRKYESCLTLAGITGFGHTWPSSDPKCTRQCMGIYPF